MITWIVCTVLAVLICGAFLLSMSGSSYDSDVYNGMPRYRENGPISYELPTPPRKEKPKVSEPVTGMTLKTGAMFTIATLKGDQLAFMSGTDNDFDNRPAAVERAQHLAKQFPLFKFFVIGPLDLVEANIPVDHKDLV